MIFANLACPLLFARMTSADIVSAVWACAAGLCVIVGIVCALLRNGKAPIQASYGESATYAQQDYIRVLGGRIPPVLSKQDASRMISALLEEKYRRDAEEAEWKALQREDAELAQVSASLATRPEYKPRKGTSQRTRDLRDLQYMIARIISDKTIDMSEVQELSTWLESHKVAPDDFADTLAILNQSAAAGSVADPDALYTSLLACVRLIRTRPTI